MKTFETIDPVQLVAVTGGANGQWLGLIGSFLQNLGGILGQGGAAPAGPAGAAGAPGAAGAAGAGAGAGAGAAAAAPRRTGG